MRNPDVPRIITVCDSGYAISFFVVKDNYFECGTRNGLERFLDF